MATTEKDIKKIVERNDLLKNKKSNFDNYWQLLAEFIMPRKGEFTTKFTDGEILNNNLFDSTAIKSNRLMASALIGILWPSGAKSFRLSSPDSIDDSDGKNKDFYEAITNRLTSVMDDSKAGLAIALDEFMLDQGCFGTSGISVFKGKSSDLSFKAWSTQQMSIDEGEDGFIDTVYFEYEWPLRRVVERYGEEVLSRESQEAWRNGDLEKVTKILHAIQPRLDSKRNTSSFSNLDMPFQSIHIEVGPNKLLEESGFEELPIMVARFRKSVNEIYGRSPGMDALPDITTLNAVIEAVTDSIDKQVDPPLVVINDGTLGGGTIDTSPGAINVFNPTGRAANEAPIQFLETNGNLNSVQFLIERLERNITEHFNIDRLLDLNNQTTMTATEVIERSQFRNQSLNSLISRQIAEVFTPLIERSFNIEFREGRLGVFSNEKMEEAINSGKLPDKIIQKMNEAKESSMQVVEGIRIPSPTATVIEIPDDIATAMLRGENIFKINYITPAARTVQAEEAQGIIKSWEFAGQVSQLNPEILDNLNPDTSLKELSKILGAPASIIRANEEVEFQRQARAEAIQEQQQVAQIEQGVTIAKDVAEADAKSRVA